MFSTAGALGLGYKDGSGVPGAEARDVGTFDRITTYGKQRVEVTVGGPTSVRVEGDDNLVDDVEVTNEDGGLVIYHYGDLDPKLELVVRVTVPTLSAIEADGLTEIRVDGLDENSFEIRADGWADVNVGGRADSVRVTAGGWSDVDLGRLTVATLDRDEEFRGDITDPRATSR